MQDCFANESRRSESVRKKLKELSQSVAATRPESGRLMGDVKRVPDVVKETGLEISSAIGQLVKRVGDREVELAQKYRKEMALRKTYHNQLMELKGR